VTKFVDFGVASHVEQPAGGVVGSSTNSLAVGEEGDGVDVGLVPHVCLNALASSDVPNLGGSVHGTGTKDVLVGRANGKGHYITRVAIVGC